MTNCEHPQSAVIETRDAEGIVARRRRQCVICHEKFSTVEIALALNKGGGKPSDYRAAIIRSLTDDDGAVVLQRVQAAAVKVLVEAFK